MAITRTGSYPIGFRRRWGQWQRDLPQLLAFARDHDFAFVDFGPLPLEEARQVLAAGVRIGCVDLLRWPDLCSPDAARRRDAVRANAEHVAALAALGVRMFMAVVTPEDPSRPRHENFDVAVDGYRQLCRAVEPLGARIAIEGFPGKEPHYGSLACTPADCRAFLGDVGNDALGINYDPSHLIRVGIDPLRFAREFASRVYHVHAKDTQLLDEGLYQHGNLQRPTFAAPRAFGGFHWRYAIPGDGAAPWPGVLAALAAARYRGLVSVELEDERFNGTREGEQRGLLQSRDFLATA